MKIAFLHGLESKPISEKSQYLHKHFDAYCPRINYHDEKSFERVLKEIQKRKIDVIVGSSMGGWYALAMSSITGIPTILFNPAVHHRSFEPTVRFEKKKSSHIVILGTKDDIIDPLQTLGWFIEVENVKIFTENMCHNIPIEIFQKYVK